MFTGILPHLDTESNITCALGVVHLMMQCRNFQGEWKMGLTCPFLRRLIYRHSPPSQRHESCSAFGGGGDTRIC